MNDETKVKADPMLQGESGRKEVTVDGDTAYIHHVTYNQPTDAHYQCQWNLDFNNISRKKLIEWAAKHLVIQLRPEFKKLNQPTMGDTHNTYSMEEYMERERGRTSPVQKVTSIVGKMSAAERAEIRAMLESDSD